MKSNGWGQQWTIVNGQFRPAGVASERLPAGVYRVNECRGWLLEPVKMVTDSLIVLPDPVCKQVVDGIEKFWTKEQKYRDRKVIYKRGILLHGPAGSGKTATLSIIAKELIKQDGIVLLYNYPMYVQMGLAMIRDIEPSRPIVCIIEEIDEKLCRDDGDEDEVLSLLDGENQVDRIVYIATTNHLERLPQTIVNRPSRFDEVIHVGMPTTESREAYLKHIEPAMAEDERKSWVIDTEGFSVAHLKELTIAVNCLDQPYAQALSRIKAMIGDPKQSKQASTRH